MDTWLYKTGDFLHDSEAVANERDITIFLICIYLY